VKVYTRAGDDGTTGLFLGGRVAKSDPLMAACGDLDETVASLGVARAALGQAAAAADGDAAALAADLAASVLRRQRELFVVAADLATNPRHRDRLVPGVSLVTDEMAADVEREIDERVARRPLRPVFVVPGATPASAALDVARSVLRRAERSVVALAPTEHPVSAEVLRYLNRLSDLVFVMAREAAGEDEPPSHD
jgi:cob(I)alamin adenosyltransferase